MSNLTYYNERKRKKITFINISNRKDTAVRMDKLENRLRMKLYDKQYIEYEIINNEVAMCDIITDYNVLVKNVMRKKVNFNNNYKQIDTKTIKY